MPWPETGERNLSHARKMLLTALNQYQRVLRQCPSLVSLDTTFSFGENKCVESGLQIEWSSRAIKDVRRLAPRNRERVIAKIEQYAGDPTSLANQVITLTGGKYRRLRVGDHRVIFNVEHGEPTTMVVLRVRHRREAYG